MKIINAVWEKRNLDETCTELFCENNDSSETLRQELQKWNSDYMVVEVPVGRVDFHRVLQECGYYYVETMFQIEKKLEQLHLRAEQIEKASHMTFTINDSLAKERTFAEIRAGMFTTDRVTIDPYFKASQGAERYIGMLTDEFKRGADFMEFLYNEDPFGFACFRRSGETSYHQSLTGIYSAYRGNGYGFSLAYLPNKYLMELGIRTLTGAVSTNNTSSLQAHLRMGFLPIDTKYVFVKHNRKSV